MMFFRYDYSQLHFQIFDVWLLKGIDVNPPGGVTLFLLHDLGSQRHGSITV